MTNAERVLNAFDRGILVAFVPKTDTESIRKLCDDHMLIGINCGNVVKFINLKQINKANKEGKK